MLYVQPDTRPGRCSSCGFLADGEEPNLPRTGFREVNPWDREVGDIAIPRCLLFAANLGAEEDSQPKLPDQPRHERTKAVISFDRHCPQWYQYAPGFTPREHRQERDMLRLEQERQALQVRLADMERETAASSAKIQADSLEISKALKDATESTSRFTTRWTIAAFVLAGLGLLFVAASYFFPDGGRQIVDWLMSTVLSPQ